MKGWRRATARRRVAMAACAAMVLLPALLARGLRPPQQHSSAHSRPAAPSARATAPRAAEPQRRTPYPGPPYLGPNGPRPAYRGFPRPINPPAGHLQSWLDAHRNVPIQRQEQLLRGDPSFRHLLPGEQQRLLQQLRDVDQLSAQQRERRLARTENLERLSPEERMSVNRSAREWTTLPPQRQARMKDAFRALRSVPPDQREIVLNSQRYRDQFTPQERGILGELLKVEPYEPPTSN